ncbi:ATP-NAD kinase family protein [Oscillibacter sp. GMB15532]|uniref:ATP-NAD kinase family protein n=1 Tax=Oscillibacter sp. GMB15532 TaxID=3230022 RepID=UPI0034E04227
MKTVGLIVNPIAGLGGSVGLKGTDGVAEEAIRRGAEPRAAARTAVALKRLLPIKDELRLLCPSGEMGERLARELGFDIEVVYVCGDKTSQRDTLGAARAMAGADLLLFAGGDGTARDIVSAGISCTVIGIPAGVKIHSPVYATRPERAGELALRFLQGGCCHTREAEVVDIDEASYRDGRVCTSLYGYLKVPDDRDFLQHGKAPSPVGERAEQESIAAEMMGRMREDVYYLIGPGSTTRTLMDRLGLTNTLLGVDLVCTRTLVQADLSERDILRRLEERETHLVLTPTGGQGYLLGRGNQQLSAQVLGKIGKERLHILATREKLFYLEGRPLLVDTGDAETDRMLSGYARVIVGFMEEQMCRIGGE